MDAQVQAVSQALLGPLQNGLDGLEAVMLPLWSSLLVIMIASGALMAAGGMGQVVHRVISAVITGVLAIIPVRYASEIIDWTVGQASTWADLAGADAGVTPYETMTAGLGLANRAFDHADVITNYLPSSWIMGLILVTAGFILLFAYFIITLLVLSCWIEMYAAALLLLPLFVFTTVAGFGAASLSGISFIMSAAVRLAAFSFLASAGLVLTTDPRFAMPEVGAEISWLQVAITVGLAAIMMFFAGKINALVVGIAMGRPGWAAPAVAVMTAVSYAGQAAMSGMTGGRAGGAGGGGGGLGGGGGGGSPSPSANGAGSGIQSTSIPVNSRTR